MSSQINAPKDIAAQAVIVALEDAVVCSTFAFSKERLMKDAARWAIPPNVVRSKP
jgi:hypothetical protein